MGICYGNLDNSNNEVEGDQKQSIPIIQQSIEEQEEKSVKFQLQDFKFLKLLGKGVFGKVLLAQQNETKQLFAIKIIDRNLLQNQSFIESEQLILSQSQSPFIIKLYFTFENQNKLYLGTEFVNGGELFIHLRRNVQFSEERTKFYAAELILALKYLHENGVIYRDLKPENILLDQLGHIKLTDFGLSKIKFDKKTYTTCGTPEYVAPEILYENGHNQTVDWYSLGILIYEMLSGLPPFYSKDKNEMIEQRLSQPIQFPNYFSSKAIDLILKLTQIEVNERLGANGADEIIRHPFFEGMDFEMISKRMIEPPYRPQLEGKLDLRYFDPVNSDYILQQIVEQQIDFDHL